MMTIQNQQDSKNKRRDQDKRRLMLQLLNYLNYDYYYKLTASSIPVSLISLEYSCIFIQMDFD